MASHSMSVSTLDFTFKEATQQLEDVGVDQPRLDARILVCHALGIERSEMATMGSRSLTDEESAAIRKLIARRSRREPVARILGAREFWSLSFGLNEATLEPRSDSETLVEVALKELKHHRGGNQKVLPPLRGELEGGYFPQDRESGIADRTPHPTSPSRGEELNILDAGTGTGCLLLALLHELPQAKGVGIDIDPSAVDQARINAENLNLQARATFRMSRWLDNIVDQTFDAIISNPPYMASGEIPALMPEVRNYDPRPALDGGADGLAAYRLLIPQLRERLKPGGFAIFEVGQGQAADVAALFTHNGFTGVTTHLDLNGIARCVKAA